MKYLQQLYNNDLFLSIYYEEIKENKLFDNNKKYLNYIESIKEGNNDNLLKLSDNEMQMNIEQNIYVLNNIKKQVLHPFTQLYWTFARSFKIFYDKIKIIEEECYKNNSIKSITIELLNSVIFDTILQNNTIFSGIINKWC